MLHVFAAKAKFVSLKKPLLVVFRSIYKSLFMIGLVVVAAFMLQKRYALVVCLCNYCWTQKTKKAKGRIYIVTFDFALRLDKETFCFRD